MPDTLALVAVYIVLVVVLLAFRLWIAIALALVGTVGLILFSDPGLAGKIIATRVNDSLYSFTLTAIPLFILMAEIISRGGGGKALYDAVAPIVERFLPGGLVHGNIIACAMFGAVCGSSIAGTAAIGSVALPQLRERGYNMPFAAGSIAAAGPLSMIIPPSLAFIIFGVLTRTSVAKLFIAGIIPGIFLAGLMMVAAVVSVRLRPHLAPARTKEKLALASYMITVGKAAPLLLLAIGIIYSIYGGIATPTEVAAVGVPLAIVITLAYRQLNWHVLIEAIGNTVRVTGTVLFLYVGASIFAVSLANVGLISFLRDTLVGLPTPPLVTVSIILITLMIMGMFIDGISLITIHTPITFPIFVALGFDPLWAGLISVLMNEIGAVTPPVGLALFVLQSISGMDPLTIAKGGIPFLIALIVGAFIFILFPIIVTWLPSFM